MICIGPPTSPTSSSHPIFTILESQSLLPATHSSTSLLYSKNALNLRFLPPQFSSSPFFSFFSSPGVCFLPPQCSSSPFFPSSVLQGSVFFLLSPTVLRFFPSSVLQFSIFICPNAPEVCSPHWRPVSILSSAS